MRFPPLPSWPEIEVDFHFDRRRAGAGDKSPFSDRIPGGRGQHCAAAESPDGGHLARSIHGGLDLDHAEDSHALGEFRLDGRDAGLDGAVAGRPGGDGKCDDERQPGGLKPA